MYSTSPLLPYLPPEAMVPSPYLDRGGSVQVGGIHSRGPRQPRADPRTGPRTSTLQLIMV